MNVALPVRRLPTVTAPCRASVQATSGATTRRRRDKGWTQPQMAERLKMGPTVLAKIEKGTRSVRMDEAVAIADLFGVSLDSLLGRRAGAEGEVADILASLQLAAGRAGQDLGAIHSTIESWLLELGGDIGFEGYKDLRASGDTALKALREAQAALQSITMTKAPERVFVSRIDELVEQRVRERIAEMLKFTQDGLLYVGQQVAQKEGDQ